MKEEKKELIKCIVFIWGAFIMYYVLINLFAR
jgi:hypothetical protein